VQTKVDGFLKDLKKAMPAMKERTATTMPDQGVTRASYQAPCACSPAPAQNSNYPITAPATPPKHLFHFIIRYEGAGIIDDSVVKFAQVQNGGKPGAACCDSSNPWVEFFSVLANLFGCCNTTVAGLNGASPGALGVEPLLGRTVEKAAATPTAAVEPVKVEKIEDEDTKPVVRPWQSSWGTVKEPREGKKETEEKEKQQPQMPTAG
jgi:hypothetical protein